jgi:hypothetical protein
MSHPEGFENVKALTRANVYFDGNVVSHTIFLPDGSRKTLGIIFPGAYEFDTKAAERIDLTVGSARVLLSGEAEWRVVEAGGSFEVAADSLFRIAVDGDRAEYICSYLP